MLAISLDRFNIVFHCCIKAFAQLWKRSCYKLFLFYWVLFSPLLLLFTKKGNAKRHEKSCMLVSGSRGRPLIGPLKNNFETETEEHVLFDCKFCSMKFRHYALARNHEKYVHLQLRQLSCSYCKKKFKRNSHVKRHEEKACQMRQKSWENLEIKPEIDETNHLFCCKYCKKSFTKQFEAVILDIHMQLQGKNKHA